MSLVLDTPPAKEPLTTHEAKLHLRVDHSDEDVYIDALISAARKHVEKNVLRRSLIDQTWNLYMDDFPGGDTIWLPRPPLQSVTSVNYTPEDGSEQTFAASNYSVDTFSEPGRIVLDSGSSWPSETLATVNGVRVEFVAGYGDAASDVSETIRQAMKLLIGHYYERREATISGTVITEIPLGAEILLWPERFHPTMEQMEQWYS